MRRGREVLALCVGIWWCVWVRISGVRVLATEEYGDESYDRILRSVKL